MLSIILGSFWWHIFSPAALASLDWSKFLKKKHVRGQFRVVIPSIPCLMKALWLSTVFNMLEDVAHCCPMVKDLIRDILVDWELKGLQSLHISLWLLKDALHRQRFSSLDCQLAVGPTQASTTKSLPVLQVVTLPLFRPIIYPKINPML